VFIGSPNYVELQTSSFTTLLNNRGADVGGQSVINLQSRFGQATRINITADASSALSPTPTQIITLTANGATSLTQNAVGGRVSIVANAGSGSGCNILGFGEIDLTAYSSAPFAGVIKESAGSILAYSGLTVPAVGIFGNSYYSALGCLSLTAGATPATTSFPGVVYLRGDNGTKVDNGFTSDTITATGNSTLPTVTTNGLTAFTGSSLAFFATSQNIQFNSATVGFNANIAGAFSVSTITNVSTINGAPYVSGGGGGGGWVSTATSILNMNGFNISSISTATASFLVGTKGNPNPSIIPTVSPLSVQNGAFHATNLPQIEFQYNDSGGYNHYIISQHDGGNANCNSVDFFIFSAGGSQSSSTAPGTGNTQAFSIKGDSVHTYKPLFMNDNYIDLRTTGFVSTTGLAYGSVAPFSVGVDGPFLFGYTQGALGTTSNANDISLAWDTSVVEIYKTLNLNDLSISNLSSITASGELSISATTNIKTSAVSTITVSSINVNVEAAEVVGLAAGNPVANYTSIALLSTSVFIAQVGDTTGVIDINAAGNIQTTAFSTINTVQNTYFDGGISRRLDGVGVPQPIIQYGQVSSSGSSGTVIVSTPQAYSAINTYLPFACMADAPAAEIYVSTLTEQAFEIGWQNGGGGAQLFNWHTMGT
jgi:hypothetical protein